MFQSGMEWDRRKTPLVNPDYIPLQNPEIADEGYISNLYKGSKAGFGGVASGLGYASEAKLGVGEDVGQWGASLVDNNGRTRQFNNDQIFSMDYLTSPSGFAYDLGGTFGSSLLIMGASAAAVAAAPVTGGGSLALGAGVAGTLDTLAEGGSTYKESLDKGNNQELANQHMNESMLLNAPASYASGLTSMIGGKYLIPLGNKLLPKTSKAGGEFLNSLVGPTNTTLGGVLKGTGVVASGSILEGMQEGYQGAVADKVLNNKDLSRLNPMNWSDEDWAVAKSTALSTGAIGGFSSGINSIGSSNKQEQLVTENNPLGNPVSNVEANLGNAYSINELDNIYNTLNGDAQGLSNDLYNDFTNNVAMNFMDDNIPVSTGYDAMRDYINRNQESLQDVGLFDVANRDLSNQDILNNNINEQQSFLNNLDETYNTQAKEEGFLESAIDQLGVDNFVNKFINNEEVQYNIKETLDENNNYTDATLDYLSQLANQFNVNEFTNPVIGQNLSRNNKLKPVSDWLSNKVNNSDFIRHQELAQSRKLNELTGELLDNMSSDDTLNQIQELRNNIKMLDQDSRNSYIKKLENAAYSKGELKDKTSSFVQDIQNKMNVLGDNLSTLTPEQRIKASKFSTAASQLLNDIKSTPSELSAGQYHVSRNNYQDMVKNQQPFTKSSRYNIYESNSKSSAMDRAINIGRSLGHKVVPMVTDSNLRGFYNKTTKTTYLNEMARDKTYTWAMGHEYSHHIRNTDKKLWDEIISKTDIPEDAIRKHQEKLNNVSSYPYTFEDAKEEYVSNAMGEWFEGNPEKLNDIISGINDPSIMDRIIKLFKEFWDKVTKTLSNKEKQDLYDTMPELLQKFIDNNMEQQLAEYKETSTKDVYKNDHPLTDLEVLTNATKDLRDGKITANEYTKIINDTTVMKQFLETNKESVNTDKQTKKAKKEANRFSKGGEKGDIKKVSISKDNLEFEKNKKLANQLKRLGWVEETVGDKVVFTRPDVKTNNSTDKEYQASIQYKEKLDLNKMNWFDKDDLLKATQDAKKTGVAKYLGEKFNRAVLAIRAETMDRFEKIGNEFRKGNGYILSKPIRELVRTIGNLSRASENVAGATYEHGSFDHEVNLRDGLGNKPVESVYQVMIALDKEFGKDYAKSSDFNNINVAAMTLNMLNNHPNMKTLMTRNEAQKIINNAPKSAINAQKKLSRATRYNLKKLQENGFMTLENYDNFVKMYPDYMNLLEVDSLEGLSEHLKNISVGKLINPKNPIQYAKDNNTNEIINVFDSIASQTTIYQRSIDSNTSLKLMRDFMFHDEHKEVLGELLTPIKEEDATNFKSTIFTWDNGKKQYYETTQGVAAVLNSLQPYTTSELMRFLSKPATLLKAGTVHTPAFAIQNLLNDMWTATMITGWQMKPWHPFKYFREAQSQGSLYKELAELGGIQGTRATVSQYSDPLSEQRSHLENREWLSQLKEGVMKGKPIQALKGVWNSIGRMAEISEQSVRLAAYVAYKNAGYSKHESAMKTRELTDFSAGGSNSFKQYTALVPFMNPVIQGLRAIFDIVFYHVNTLPENAPLRKIGIKTTRGSTLFSAGCMALLGMIVESAFGDDDDWKNTPEYIKATNIVIPNGQGGIVRMPFGRELSVAFYRTPQIIMEAIKEKNPELVQDHAKKIILSVLPPLIPAIVLQLGETTANYSVFRDRPIVPTSEKDKPAVMQYGPYTSETMKYISRGLNSVGIEVSPRKLQYFFEQTTSSVGKFGLSFVDGSLRATGVTKNMPEMTLIETMPFIRDYIKDNPGNEQTQKALSIATNYKEDKQLVKAKLMDKNDFNSNKAERIISLQGEIMRDFRTSTEILNDTKMSSENKRKKLDEVEKRQEKLAKKIIAIHAK